MLAVKTLGPELTESGAPACSATTRAPTSLFDASGTLYEADDIDGNKTQYAYDAPGNPTAIVRTTSDNLSSIATSATWDMAGRLKHRSDPNAGAQDSTYFASGRTKRLTLASHALAGGSSGSDYVDFTYDQGRLATRNVCTASSSGGAVGWTCAQDVYSYDVAQAGGTYSFVPGRMASAQNANATINFGYDANGSIVQRDEQLTGVPGQFSLAATRLSTGQPTSSSFSSPYNETLTYSTSYDSMLRAVQLSSGATTYWNANSGSLGAYGCSRARGFDFRGQWRGAVLVVVCCLQRDGGRHAGASRFGESGSLPCLIRGVSRNAARLVHRCPDRHELRLHLYRWRRLRSAKVATGSTLNSLLCLSFNRNKNFTPGASFGNLERVRDQAPAAPAIDLYSYSGTDIANSGSGPDAPASIGPQQGTPTNTFGYDYAGRIISKSSGGEALTYDPLGRLISVTRANAPGEVLTYDALGQLVGRLSGSTLTYYVGSAATATTAKPSACTAPGCTLDTPTPPITVDAHVYAGSRRIATVRAGITATGRILYYHRDRLGSVVATSTDGGVAGATYRYDVYGSMTVQAETPDTISDLGFTGQLRLSGGLYLMGMRIYDAGLRQFLQPDVFDPMSYTYANGDPINVVDPTGMAGEEIIVTGSRYRRDHGEYKVPLEPGDIVVVIERGSSERGSGGSSKAKVTVVRRRKVSWRSRQSGLHGFTAPVSTSALAAVALAYNSVVPELELLAVFTGPAAPFVEAGINITAGAINLALVISALDERVPLNVEMSKKSDNKQIDDLLNLNPEVNSDDFRDFLHEVKRDQGMRPNETFTWKQLNALIREYKDLNGL